MKKLKRNQGFTLIELVMVIAILAIITVAGITQFGTMKYKSAKKVATANIKQIFAALQEYNLVNESTAGRFNNFESLIDLSITGTGTGKAWTGTPGQFMWLPDTTNNCPGIYDGSYKVLAATYNAVGGGGGTPDILKAKEQNHGLTDSLVSELGIYYLTARDVEVLNTAGIEKYLMHNCSTMQAWGPAKRGPACIGNFAENGDQFVDGGPGFRVDLSAFYPATITAGSPVAIVSPISYNLYKTLGYDLSLTTNQIENISSLTAKDLETKIATTKLLVFGIGSNSSFVLAKNGGLGTEPRCNAYDRSYYRKFLAVFALTGSGSSETCVPVGVLDCDGQTYKDSLHQVEWRMD